jgi:DNA-binding Lrp family transcriptional regulator
LVKAFVLINAEFGAEYDTLENVKKIHEVLDTHMVFGAFDIVALVETVTMQELKEVITIKIRQTKKVTNTTTMVVI